MSSGTYKSNEDCLDSSHDVRYDDYCNDYGENYCEDYGGYCKDHGGHCGDHDECAKNHKNYKLNP